jgi:hypothetical protein
MNAQALSDLTAQATSNDRNFPDWLNAYVNYAGFSEAPKKMHFWSGVSAVAGALRRRVWLDMGYFKWTPCFYILIVAPPGVVSKSTTAAIAIDLLRQVPGIKFGPQMVTWPALVKAFSDAREEFEFEDAWHPMCAMTIESSELGNLLNPQDREMIDLLVTLWDSKTGALDKRTKTSGSDEIVNPWINMIACTTPAWIEGNFPEYVIGGGFTSRCLFVYAEKKEKLVAYPARTIPPELVTTKEMLLQDLEKIAMMTGPFQLDAEALDWGTAWYAAHNSAPPDHLADERFSGYLARKQTHMHKLAMILSAARSDAKIITLADLVTANQMLNDLEVDMPKVFARIGRSEQSIQAERFIKHVQQQGKMPYSAAYQFIHMHFPQHKDFEGMLVGAIRSGQLDLITTPQGNFICGKAPTATP